MQTNKILDLFPTPLYINNYNKTLNPAYEDFLLKASRVSNMGNTRSENGYILDIPLFSDIKDFARQCINEYVQTMYGNINLDIYITQSWANYTEPNQFHHKHIHPNSFLSGVFYVSAIKGVDMIRFHKDKLNFFDIRSAERNNYNSQDVAILIETGDLVLFPSHFTHDVPVTTSNKTRISIAFNTFIRGYLGEELASTALYLK